MIAFSTAWQFWALMAAVFAAATGASVADLVPEPATAGIVALGELALMRRRR